MSAQCNMIKHENELSGYCAFSVFACGHKFTCMLRGLKEHGLAAGDRGDANVSLKRSRHDKSDWVGGGVQGRVCLTIHFLHIK